MFAMSERVSPWRARCSPRSVGRVTTISPSCWSTAISRDTRSWSSPFGPFTLTSSGSMTTSTPSGTGIGCFPMRLTGLSSPHPRHQLAAHALAARVVAGHDAARGGDDRRAHSALDLRDAARVYVATAAGLRESLDPGDHRPAVLGVLQADAQRAPHATRLDLVPVDVALLLQDARDLRLEVGGGHLHLVVVGPQSVADAGQEVCDRVGLHRLPARLRQAGDHALVGDLAQADAAQPELAQIRARAAAPLAAVVVPCLVLRAALLADLL